ncbi:MAG: hypothetical protein PHY40_04260 [Patescibacteria group bacterium]|nr:hypothetical protein [Patescibacteria group bacterium]
MAKYNINIPMGLKPWEADNWRAVDAALKDITITTNKVDSPTSGLSAGGSKVKVNKYDSTSEYLEDKIVASNTTTFVQSNDGMGAKEIKVHSKVIEATTVPSDIITGELFFDTDARFGTPFTIGDGEANIDYEIKVDGETNDGSFYWMEDEDYFKYVDSILMDAAKEIYFRDTAIHIKSADDGHLDLTADTAVDINATTTALTGDITLLDSEKVLLGTGQDMDIYYDGTDAHIHTDLVAASDLNIDCGTDKTIVLDETVWDDLRVVPGSFDRPGVGGATPDPTLVPYDVNAGGVITYLWQFQLTATASFTVQVPHGYKHGTDILAHVHWTPGPRGTAESGKTVGWKLEYSWANIGGNFGTMLTADMSDACDGTNHKHQMTPEATIDGHTASKSISSMILCNIRRTDTGTDDTWVGTVSGELPMLLEIDFHFQIDTIGSRQSGTK